eukprot:CAMPEP_0180126432 /NCGR_PEP_ID=MMETSP0986-20121125/5710_1 /TAXON_ID=697907 /ORGANISM="non described non described, Strain CCMP2293" /LENGTH=66 /DNA_ID=CAMNT_0022065895 /DNA_START=594 /DNA_END=794 /DNA_ORIENTATION=+
MFQILTDLIPSTGTGGAEGYITTSSGQFDGQGSGHDFYGTLYMPPSGSVNSCDGGRSHTYCDYRQQ